MPTINLKKLDQVTYEVAVESHSSTIHTVTVQPQYAHKLTGGQVSVDELIRRSFEFLLERESNSSILRRFDLAVIAQYFPEYEPTMRKILNTPA